MPDPWRSEPKKIDDLEPIVAKASDLGKLRVRVRFRLTDGRTLSLPVTNIDLEPDDDALFLEVPPEPEW